MTWDLAGAKARLQIADTSKDALITSTLATSLAVAELYCNRKFSYAAERATFTHPHGEALQLSRFPIEQVVSVNGDNNQAMATGKYHVINNTGQIILDGSAYGHRIIVDYAGGYKTLPDDLILALWGIFDAVYAASSNVGNATPAGSAAIQSITIPDVGTVRYESGGAASGASGAGGAAGIIPAVSAMILNLYRLEVC